MSDLKLNLLMDFFSDQGATFVDADTREPIVDTNLTLCKGCWCMTKTNKKNNSCLKCGAKKGDNMELKKKIPLNKLYFGVRLYPMSYSSKDKATDLETYNLFDFGRVKKGVARYVTMKSDERKRLSNPLSFCFGDVWGRCECEFVVCPWGGLKEGAKVEEVGLKMDTYEMYVKPNADLLMDMVNRVTVSSARKYLSEERKRRQR